MSRLVIYLGRLIVISFGFMVAALAASLALHVLALPITGLNETIGPDAPEILSAAMLFSVPFVALFVGYFAFMPSIAAIVIAEFWSVRSWLYHALAGGVIGVAVASLFQVTSTHEVMTVGSDLQVLPPDASISNPGFLVMMIGAGMFGGIAYWAVAGRSSGQWRSRAAETLSPNQ